MIFNICDRYRSNFCSDITYYLISYLKLIKYYGKQRKLFIYFLYKEGKECKCIKKILIIMDFEIILFYKYVTTNSTSSFSLKTRYSTPSTTTCNPSEYLNFLMRSPGLMCFTFTPTSTTLYSSSLW